MQSVDDKIIKSSPLLNRKLFDEVVLSGIRVNKAHVFKFHLYPIFKISKFHTVAGNMNDLYLRAASKIKLIQINSVPF